jgi:hypothetical protein
MQHKLYESIDEMLAPATLSRLSGQTVKYVSCLPMPGGYSGSILLAVRIDSDAVPSYVVKRMSTRRDWLMLASDDRCCRSAALWQHSILDRLTPFVDHTIVACAHDDEGYAILMHNIGNRLLRDVPFTAREVRYLLDVLAAIHATYWNAPELTEPLLGLCDLAGMLRTHAVETARRLPSQTNPAPQMILEGWDLLQEWLASDVVDVLESLMSNPQPLCDALAGYPFTLVHGDYRSANLGLMLKPTPRAFVLDWQLAARGAATIDLAFFLTKRQLWLSSITVAAATDYYRGSLARRLGNRFDADTWLPLLELGKLVDILRFAAVKAWFAAQHANEADGALERERLLNYNEQVRAALKWL